MPIKGIFRTEDSLKGFRLYKKLYSAIKAQAKQHDLSTTELINYALAERFAPEIIYEFEEFKRKPRYKKALVGRNANAKNQKQVRSD